MKKLMTMIFLMGSLISSTASFAEWTLLPEQSHIHFISTKKTSVAEIHTFKKFSGNISNKGKLSFIIDLDSVETLIPIRNERMRKFLFETAKFQNATVKASVDASKLSKLKVGQTLDDDIDVELDLHGVKHSIEAQLKAVKLAGDKLLVTSSRPLVMSMADFGLVNGVERLREIAKLPSISVAVPATVSLVFQKK